MQSCARQRMKLQQLEEKQALEKRHLAEKHQLEEEMNDLDEVASNRSRISGRSSNRRVQQWQDECAEQTEGAPNLQSEEQVAASPVPQNTSRVPESTKDDKLPSPIVPDINKQPLNSTVKPKHVSGDQQQAVGAFPSAVPESKLIERQQQQQTGAFSTTVPAVRKVSDPTGNDDTQNPPVVLHGKQPVYQNEIHSLPPNYNNSFHQMMKQFGHLMPSATVSSFNSYSHPPETVPPLGTNTTLPYNMNPTLPAGNIPLPPGFPPVEQFTPSPSQLAARQVMPRDLPMFSGNPADWPIFISSFMNTTLACGYNCAENLARLQRCLKGPAYQSVESRLLLPDSVPQVIDTLRLLYGRPELLVSALLDKVRSVPVPKAEKLETIIDFGMAVRSLCDHLEAAGQQDHLSNPTLLMELVEKLPTHTKMQWADYLQQHPVVNLKTFGEFMLGVITAISRVTMYTAGSSGPQKQKQKGSVNTHINETEQMRDPARENERWCACCKKMGHRVSECAAFRSYSVDNRWKFVQNNGLCRSCLNAHGRRSCRNATQCVIEGCKYRHHPLLHSNRSSRDSDPVQDSSNAENHTHRQSDQSLLFRIIPVTICGPQATIETFAFLDDGSSLSLVEHELVEQLGIDGWTKPLCLKWTGNVTRVESESKQVRITIRGATSQKKFTLNDVRTVKELTLPEQCLRYDELANRFRHLKGLPIVGYERAVPRLLIGVNNLSLTVPLQVKEGKKNEPVAVKTRLGWCVFGGSDRGTTHTLHYHACECVSDQDLHSLVRDYFALDDVGARPSPQLESEEDKRARRIMEGTTVRVGDKFETGLLWRYDHVEFPDSYSMAVKRFECLERRMVRDPELAANLRKQIAEYQVKGYAHRATESELSRGDPKRVWYLPLGAVMNPRKPGKVRLIWDAAAKVDGISLNSMLLKGPDQLTSLPAVLSRFRQYRVGVSADIKEMFHQISIREQDRHSQRFLWRNNPKETLETFLMDVVTFGSSSSPASAQFVKNKNAEEFATQFPRAVEAIVRNHYVDDFLDSFEDDKQAARVSNETRFIHHQGGFQLRNWLSNSADVLREMKEEDPQDSKSLCLKPTEGSDRVLGMLWLTVNDELQFAMKMKDEIQQVIDSAGRPTKRQLLKCLMGIFDPLGLLSVFLVHGKILLQDVWRAGLQWDEKVPDDIFDRWTRWTGLFPKVRDLRIPRCYFAGANAQLYEFLELHVFVDASEVAFSAVAYFRVVKPSGEAECSLVAARTKVAPLKPLSIPRLELQAAVLGTRLMSSVLESHTVEVKQCVLWSDSATVLAWLRADHRQYKQYVACPIGELLSTTDVAQWRWVPSKLNPADAATKWGKCPCPAAADVWFTGPEYLSQPEEHWPKQRTSLIPPEEELRSCYVVQEHLIPDRVVEFNRFSKWRRLSRAVAYVHRFIDNISRRLRGEQPEILHLTQEELKKAKNSLMRMVQWEVYPEEMIALSTGRTELAKSSSLFKKSPAVDEFGVLRIDGRIGAAPHTQFDTRYPVILPRKHLVTELIVDDYHRALRHANSETVVNEIRQHFHIPRLRTVVKQVATACRWCKLIKATPKVPRMAPLPPARLASFVRPFTYTGIDLFGPLVVKVGRSAAKRWICLFTCLTTRAVHVEVAYSLSTPSTVKCITRFVSRRGSPAEIYSDNGTNFVGAARLLREQVVAINHELAATFTNTDTKWIFIPPAAPHMGGAWERMVRSIKTAMETAYYNNSKLDDEGLATLVVAAEAIVNRRPLTYLPLDAAEKEALTPNHFLLGSSNGVLQPATAFTDPALALKSSWYQIQHQLDIFWKRWIREYLPMLTKRTKWFGEVKPLANGDLVLIVDDSQRNGWLRGRILEAVAGKDGRIRQAIVQTTKGILRRPVSKLAVLEVQTDGKTGSDDQCYGGENVAHGNPSSHKPTLADKVDAPRRAA
ncbi:uncharacterized protein LOC128739367 [Sabethes cyaneus]|uniref:uncharacterized protein LOC128739367 n=1 Tax=Sabethes cyaneus TaxID=53552 RepID=UPI00237D70DB|nr:uncharacterized protein LOC128739367 [Sabethes cyaneus]